MRYLAEKKNLGNIYLGENGIIVTDPKLVASLSKSYFLTAAENLVKNLDETESNFQDYLHMSNEYRISLKYVQPEEIKEQLLKLNMKKSSDFHGSSSKLLKATSDTWDISDISLAFKKEACRSCNYNSNSKRKDQSLLYFPRFCKGV